MRHPLACSLAAAVLVAGCGPDEPQIAMCQELAKNLVGDIAGWERTDQEDGRRARQVSIAYSTNADTSGSIECNYPINRESGAIATAPREVVLNGRRLETGELFAAGTRASGKIIADTADATADRTRELAGEAGEKAGELTERARDAALEGTKALQEALER